MSEKKSEYQKRRSNQWKATFKLTAQQLKKEQKFELLSKANAFRDKVKENKKRLSDHDEALAKLTEEEKNI